MVLTGGVKVPTQIAESFNGSVAMLIKVIDILFKTFEIFV